MALLLSLTFMYVTISADKKLRSAIGLVKMAVSG